MSVTEALAGLASHHAPTLIAEDAPHEQTALCSRDAEVWPCEFEQARRLTEPAVRLSEALERLPKDHRHYVVERYPDEPDAQRWYCGIFEKPWGHSGGFGPTLPDAIDAALSARPGEEQG